MSKRQRSLVIGLPDKRTICSGVAVRVANTFWTRAIGLLTTSSLNDQAALWITPCASIHTIGMRYPIDVVFLDRSQKVLKIAHSVRPFGVSFAPKGTKSVLEMASGNAIRTGIVLEAVLSFD